LPNDQSRPPGRGGGAARLAGGVFNAVSGKKLLTFDGKYSGNSPEDLLKTTGWLTARYFIIPLGTHRERCLVCDFVRPLAPLSIMNRSQRSGAGLETESTLGPKKVTEANRDLVYPIPAEPLT
jgi:hypothetical protein